MTAPRSVSTARLATRLPLIAAGMAALLAGMWAGLLRLGWGLPAVRPTFINDHGPLMVAGFLGTLISVERAVALGRPWAFASPLLTAIGALGMIAGLPEWAPPAVMVAGGLALVTVVTAIARLQPALFTITMVLGALAFLAANALWLGGWSMARVGSWFAGFLVLTIAAERLELSRFAQLSDRSRFLFIVAAAVFLAGLVLGGVSTSNGARLTGLGLLALAVWLLRHDIARRTVRQHGLTRFTAVCLLSGYAWLGVGGLLALRFGGVDAGPPYDAMLHALLLGFVFAMIFGHAPIIFPALLGIPVPFRPAFYAHWIVLQLSLILRLYGDLAEALDARAWGGLLNAVAVLIFLANTVRSAGLGLRAAQNPPTVS